MVLILAVVLAFYACSPNNKKAETLTESNVATNTYNCYSSSSLYGITINFDNQVPGDLEAFNNQSQVDCFAWQEFISLNWPTVGNNFGTPQDKSFVQWETYMPKDVLFQPDGVAPPAWGTLVSEAYAKKYDSERLLVKKQETKLLTFTSKISGSDTLFNFDFQQAAPGNGPNWLGAQNGTNVWYEIMLNKDYYDFVVAKGYYNAVAQHDSAKAGIPLVFPKGVYNGATGAIELKAAWMEVTNPTSAQWNRYKLSDAVVMDATTGQLRNTTVALVGLHILHKTTNQPTWVWATFEQIDNVPSSLTPPHGYNFNNPNCQSQTVKLKDGTTAVVPCTTNSSPSYYLKDAEPVPLQISRVNPIDPVDAAPINQKMQQEIHTLYPNSVWQYYELVDVIWSQSLQPDPTSPILAPKKLNVSSMLSGAHIVANTTLESYVQSTNTCYSCHVYGTIAPFPGDSANDDVFGDFSFVIGSAKYSQSQLNEMTSMVSKLKKE